MVSGWRGIGSAATRIGDEERERALAELRRHYADGRLDPEELEQRSEAVVAARTRGELVPPLADLPGAVLRVASAPLRRRVGEAARRADRAAIRGHAWTFGGLNGGALAVWAIGGAGAFWPALVLVPTTLLLGGHVRARRAIRRRLAAPGPPARRAADPARRRGPDRAARPS